MGVSVYVFTPILITDTCDRFITNNSSIVDKDVYEKEDGKWETEKEREEGQKLKESKEKDVFSSKIHQLFYRDS